MQKAKNVKHFVNGSHGSGNLLVVHQVSPGRKTVDIFEQNMLFVVILNPKLSTRVNC